MRQRIRRLERAATFSPTTSNPTTSNPTTAIPTTAEPTISAPSTNEPTTANPTTSEPTIFETTNNFCGSNDDAKILDYVYDFKYRKKKQRLVVKLFVCCDAGAEFDDSYVVPKGYAPRKNGNGSGRRLLTENGTVSTMN